MEDAVERRFKKIEAILQSIAESQAAATARADERMTRAEERMDRAEARMDRAEERMDRAEARMDRMETLWAARDARFEKRMRGFETLVKIGMREIADLRRLTVRIGEKLDRFIEETDVRINELVDSQQRTEAMLRAFLKSRSNGHNGGRSR